MTYPIYVAVTDFDLISVTSVRLFHKIGGDGVSFVGCFQSQLCLSLTVQRTRILRLLKTLPNLLGVLQTENNVLQHEHPAAGHKVRRKKNERLNYFCLLSDKKRSVRRIRLSFSLKLIIFCYLHSATCSFFLFVH